MHAVEQEIKGSLRKKDKKRKKVAVPEQVTDSRVLLQQAQAAQTQSVKEEQAEKARSRAGTMAPTNGVYDNLVKGDNAASAGEAEPALQTAPSDVEDEASVDDDGLPAVEDSSSPEPAEEEATPPSPAAAAPPSPAMVAPPSPAMVAASKGPPPTQAPVPKSLAARLGGSIKHSVDYKTTLEADEERRSKATKLFKAPDQHDNRSKIYQALNPKPLYYESRREKEEAADDANVSG